MPLELYRSLYKRPVLCASGISFEDLREPGYLLDEWARVDLLLERIYTPLSPKIGHRYLRKENELEHKSRLKVGGSASCTNFARWLS